MRLCSDFLLVLRNRKVKNWNMPVAVATYKQTILKDINFAKYDLKGVT
jgi:hypothetical protein